MWNFILDIFPIPAFQFLQGVGLSRVLSFVVLFYCVFFKTDDHTLSLMRGSIKKMEIEDGFERGQPLFI